MKTSFTSFKRAANPLLAVWLTFFVFAYSAAIAQETVALDVSISPENPQPGETVTVSFETQNTANAALFFYGLEVEYDASRFSFEGISAGDIMGDNALQIGDNLSENSIGASVVSTSEGNTGAGTLATLEFTTLFDSAEGSALFAFSNNDLRDDAGESLTAQVPASAEVIVQQGDTFTVHYNNPNEWAEVFTYAFSSEGGDYIPFPGEAMTPPEGDSEWFSYEIPQTFNGAPLNRVIFNNGGNGEQTEDLERSTDGWYDGTRWYDSEPDFDATRPVTFSVDMSAQIADESFDPETGQVTVAGSFNDWSTTEFELENTEDFVYETTVDIIGPEDVSVEYKFIADGDFEGDVGEGAGGNRVLSLGPDGQAQVLDTVFFNNEAPAPEPETRSVTFSVDMSVQIAAGNFNPEEDEATLSGSFFGWEDALSLDAGENDIYSAEITIEGEAGETEEYKFGINGDLEGEVGDGDNGNRVLTLGPADEPQTLDTVFFNNEDEFAEPETRSVTFSVDMSVQIAAGNFNPEEDEATLSGSFFGWEDALSLDAGENDIYLAEITVEGEAGETEEYKFGINGDLEGEVGDGDNGNRVLTLGPADEPQTLDTVFFNNEEGEDLPETVVVWPGDTNNDGIVNEQDVLPLGIYWNNTGPVREDATTDWEGQEAEVWNPIPATYADTDGSGLINQTDLLAIGLNFGETHGEATEQESTPLAEADLPALNAVDRILVSLRSPEPMMLQGASFSVRVEGLETEDFQFQGLRPGTWANEWQEDNAMIDFERSQGMNFAAATVHKGITEAVMPENIFIFEIEPLQNWTSNATLFVERAGYVSESGSQLSFDEIEAEIEVIIGTSTDNGEVPVRTALHQNYPNPFNPTTNIAFDLQESSAVTLEVLNVLGQRVALLANREQMSAGSYTQSFDASNLPSGMYLIRMSAGEQHFTRKMMLVK